MKISALALFVALATPVVSEIYLQEDFNDENWTSRWTESTTWKPKGEMGTWEHTAGEWYDSADDKGIQTSVDARFYGISAPLSKTIANGDKDLIIQYSVKHEQNLDCGGAYIKLLSGEGKFDSAGFGGDTPYGIMFGPDMCGSSNRKTHVILHSNTKDENLLIKKEVNTETDDLTHLYTLILKTDNTFDVQIDQKSVRTGKLEDEFDFLVAKEIKDPDESKPEDWVDTAKIADPEDEKPEGYDEQEEEIPDPEAEKPDDWDDEDDGEWEAPMIDNPDFNGDWKPKMIDNPDYKGKWVHPMVANPDYVYDETMAAVCKDGCTHVGFEIWQVKTGTLFDDIIVTDDIEEAKKFAEATFFKKKEGEKAMYDKKMAEKAEEESASADEMDMEGDEDDYSMDVDGMADEF